MSDFAKTIEVQPRNVLAHYYRAHANKAKGDYDAAFAGFTKTIELAPDYGAAHSSLGLAHYERGHFSEAAEDFGRAAELEPAKAWPYVLFVWLANARMEKRVEATEELRKYLESGVGADERAWYREAARFLINEVTMEKLLEEVKNEAQEQGKSKLDKAYFYVGSVCLLDGNIEQASSYFEKCVDTGEPNSVEFHAAKAELARMNIASGPQS